MARPVYIICSRSRSIDQATNQLSLFNVIEGYHVYVGKKQDIRQIPSEQRALLVPPVVACTSLWMADETDKPEDEFEYQIVIHRPGQQITELHAGTFKFKGRFQRFIGNVRLESENLKTGVLTIENRVRRKGDQDWMVQTYPLPIVVVEEKEAEDENTDLV